MFDRRQLGSGVGHMLIDGAKHNRSHRVIAHRGGQFEHTLFSKLLDDLRIKIRWHASLLEDGAPEPDDEGLPDGNTSARRLQPT